MIKISADTYPKNCVSLGKVNKKHKKLVLWIKMHNIKDKLGVQTCLI